MHNEAYALFGLAFLHISIGNGSVCATVVSVTAVFGVVGRHTHPEVYDVDRVWQTYHSLAP